MTRRPAALLLTAVLVVPACTARTGGPAAAAPPAPTTTATTTAVTTTTPPPPPPPRKAKDGGDIGACRDGVCEVRLIRRTVSLGCTGDPACRTTIVGTSPPVAFATAHPGAYVAVNNVMLTIPAAADGTAILRLGRA